MGIAPPDFVVDVGNGRYCWRERWWLATVLVMKVSQFNLTLVEDRFGAD